MLTKMNEFVSFNHDEFLKGKMFAVAKVEEKFEYDKEAKKSTDKRTHINVELDIVVDDYVYSKGRDYEEVGVNTGERIVVRVKNPDADVDDYLELLGDGFTRVPVEIVDIVSSKLTDEPVGKPTPSGYQPRKVDLSIEGDVIAKVTTSAPKQLD